MLAALVLMQVTKGIMRSTGAEHLHPSSLQRNAVVGLVPLITRLDPCFIGMVMPHPEYYLADTICPWQFLYGHLLSRRIAILILLL